MYRASCTVYCPDQQLNNMCINNILYTVSTLACFSVYASSSGSLNLVLCWRYQGCDWPSYGA